MPDAPSWVAGVSDILYTIRSGDQEWFTRADIETLLGLQSRQAQKIMAEAGAEKDGKAYLLSRSHLIEYLERVAPDERERVRRLAERITVLREEFIKRPKLLVEMPTREVEQLERDGLAGLPAEITLEPGRITLDFGTDEEALQLLLRLSVAIARDRLEFARVVERRQIDLTCLRKQA